METKMKLFDSELKVMEVLWKEGEISAKQTAVVLKEQIGWNQNTTYTVIGRLIEKGAIERRDPNFICKAKITREEVQNQEAVEIVGKLFNGSVELFLSAFLSGSQPSAEEIEKLKQLINSFR